MSNPSQSWSGTVTVGASEPAREYSQRSQIPHDVLPELKAELPQSHLPLWGGAEVCFGEDDGARGRRRKIWAWRGDTVGSRCEPSLHRCVASAPQSDGPRCMPRLHLALLLVCKARLR